MRTTIDISDPLYRRIKALAALRGETLKAFLMSILEREVSTYRGDLSTAKQISFPLVRSTKPGSKKITAKKIAEVLEKEDLDVLA